MEEKKLLFIFNPKSGKGLIRNHLLQIIDIFVKSRYQVTVYPTQEPEDARARIPQVADDYDLIVCSGGDGTLDEVVSGMMNCDSKTPVGYVPAGSTNDFAQSLKIPLNMEQAAEVAVKGTPFPCDVGRFNEDYFVYIAAFGLFTDVSYQTNQRLKNIFGHVAYVLESAKRLYDVPSYFMDVDVNGRHIRDEFVYGMITNSTSVAGLKNMTGNDVELDDGLFEVTLIRMPQNPIQLNEILRNLIMPKPVETPYIYTFKTDHIEMSCEDYVPWTLDGEFGGSHREVEIANSCRRITFMV